MKKIAVIIICLILSPALIAQESVTHNKTAAEDVSIDTTPPVINKLISSSHTDAKKWHANKRVTMEWQGTDDSGGPVEYFYSIDMNDKTKALNQKTNQNRITFETEDGLKYFHLQGVDSAGNKSKVLSYKIQVDSTPPEDIGGLKVFSGKDKKQELSSDKIQGISDQPYIAWSKSNDSESGVGFYQIYWGEDPQGEPDISLNEAAFSPTAAIVSNTKYYLRGSVVDQAGNTSEVKELFIFEYDGIPPDRVAEIFTKAVPTENLVILNWEKPEAQDIAGFDVYRKIKGGDYVKLNKTPIDPEHASYRDNTVVRGQSYLYAVRAVDIVGNISELSQEVGVPYVKLLDRQQVVTHDWDDDDTPLPGATITYTITFSNEGFSEVQNLAFQDYIPDNTTYTFDTAECSKPVKIYYWNEELNSGKGGWTEKQTKKTSVIKRIKWAFDKPLPPVKELGEESGELKYSVTIDYI